VRKESPLNKLMEDRARSTEAGRFVRGFTDDSGRRLL